MHLPMSRAVRTDFRDGLGADFLDLFLGKLLRQKLVDDGDFLPLLLGNSGRPPSS